MSASPSRVMAWLRARIPDRTIWRVYAICLLLGHAYGIAIAVLSLFLRSRGHEPDAIGSLATYFALGIVACSLPMSALIRFFGARDVLAVSLLGYAAATAIFPFLGSFAAIAAARVLDGAFSVGVWTSSETILLSRAQRDNKAFVTSLYAISLSAGYVTGPVLARGIDALLPSEAAFVVAGLIAALGAVLAWWGLDRRIAVSALPHAYESEGTPHQVHTPEASLSWGTLAWRIKTCCVAVLSYGYFQAALVAFMPIYLHEERHLPREHTIVLPAFFGAGMLLLSNVIGRVGDRFGHLATMRVLSLGGAAMIGLFLWASHFALMALTVFFAGAALTSVWPLSLALQGAIVPPADYSRSNAVVNVFYASGMILGPLACGAVYERFGGLAAFGHLGALWGVFVLASVVFSRDDPAARRA